MKIPMKKLDMVIKGICDGCPYCVYNGDYGRSYHSGYDRDNPDLVGNKRIVDDEKGWKFPPIMENCPLPNWSEK